VPRNILDAPARKEKKKDYLPNSYHLCLFYGKSEKFLSKNSFEIFAGETSLSFSRNSTLLPLVCTPPPQQAPRRVAPQRSCPTGGQALRAPKPHFGLILQVSTDAPLAAGALPLEN